MEVVMGVRVVEIVAGSAVDSDATVVEETGVVVEGSAVELSVDASVVELVEAGVVDSVVAAVVLYPIVVVVYCVRAAGVVEGVGTYPYGGRG